MIYLSEADLIALRHKENRSKKQCRRDMWDNRSPFSTIKSYRARRNKKHMEHYQPIPTGRGNLDYNYDDKDIE